MQDAELLPNEQFTLKWSFSQRSELLFFVPFAIRSCSFTGKVIPVMVMKYSAAGPDWQRDGGGGGGHLQNVRESQIG